jgi:serine/threonine protein phosphatase PrpC
MGEERSDQPEKGVTPYFEPKGFPPASALVVPSFGAYSRRGRLHPVNEDHYLVITLGRNQETVLTSLPEDLISKRFDEYGFAMIVADGLGTISSAAGEAASRIALVTLLQLILNYCKWNLRIDDPIAEQIMDRAERFVRHVDSAVVYEGAARGLAQPQTTLTAVFGAGHDLFFAHVGHSRAYLLRERSLLRLTRDHTLSSRRLAPLAPLVDVKATGRDLMHVLTQTIGMNGTIGPIIDLERFQLADGDRILVCTNGVTDALDESIVAGVLASDAPLADQARQLVDQAMEAAGDDDATALVAGFRISGRLQHP